jgi:hypothetical protein
MNSVIRNLMLSIAALFLTGLASAASTPTPPEVTTRYDHSVDFSAYRTFAFFEPLAVETAGYEPVVAKTMKAAARAEMEKRGYVYAETGADLLVNLSGKLAKQLEVKPVESVAPPVYFTFRQGYYSDWSEPGQTEVTEYTEGTINVDLIEAKSKKLVWEGVAVGRATKKTKRNREATLTTAVAEIFSKYEFRPGP